MIFTTGKKCCHQIFEEALKNELIVKIESIVQKQKRFRCREKK